MKGVPFTWSPTRLLPRARFRYKGRRIGLVGIREDFSEAWEGQRRLEIWGVGDQALAQTRMHSGAAAMTGRRVGLFASRRGWSSGIRPSLWLMVLSGLFAGMEGGSTVGLRPNRWRAAPAGDEFGLFMGEGQYQAQMAAESAWNHGDVPSDVLSGFGGVSRARTFSPVTDSDSEVAISLQRPSILDAWHPGDDSGFRELDLKAIVPFPHRCQ